MGEGVRDNDGEGARERGTEREGDENGEIGRETLRDSDIESGRERGRRRNNARSGEWRAS